MRTMLLFRGAPGCGKSTYIKELGIQDYTLSADDIRLLIQSPSMMPDGSYSISMKNDNTVWSILFDALEHRMERGEFVVIDATNSKTADMQKYKKIAETHRYRMYIMDLTDIPIEVCKDRNSNRIPEYKRVPEEVIDNQYARFATQGIPGGIKKIIKNEQGVLQQMSFDKIDFSNYNKIHHIGDLHGCYTVLKEYMDENYNDNDLFIFTGDYVDRGIENNELISYLIYLSSKKNTIFLEGNHEVHLRKWAHDIKSKSKEFNEITAPQLEALDKADVRKFCRNLRQLAYYTFNDKVVLACHGGIPKITEPLLFIPTEELIKGVGEYEDSLSVCLAFESNTPDNYYQIHGHRNIEDLPVKCTDRCFNLEGQVEQGGHLRIVTLDKEGFKTIELENKVYKIHYDSNINMNELKAKDMYYMMMENNLVKKVFFNSYDAVSFNFKPQVFKGRIWNDQTIKARGLFFDKETKEIILRSYDKFFNIGERENTKLNNLRHSLQFPVSVYHKYNGFLGLLSTHKDELLFGSKSSLTGEHVQYFKKIFNDTFTQEQQEGIKKFNKENNTTMVFEVIDPINDPHIIKYDKPKVVLIDIVYNEVKFRKVDYETLYLIGASNNIEVKERTHVIENWREFFMWHTEVTEEGYKYNGEYLEGFIVEDADGFQTKLKLHYYNLWKLLRGVVSKQAKFRHINFTGALKTPESNMFYGWVKEQKIDLLKKADIITLRDMFLEETNAGDL